MRYGRASFIARLLAKSPWAGIGGAFDLDRGSRRRPGKSGSAPEAMARSQARATAARTELRIGVGGGGCGVEGDRSRPRLIPLRGPKDGSGPRHIARSCCMVVDGGHLRRSDLQWSSVRDERRPRKSVKHESAPSTAVRHPPTRLGAEISQSMSASPPTSKDSSESQSSRRSSSDDSLPYREATPRAGRAWSSSLSSSRSSCSSCSWPSISAGSSSRTSS